MNRREFLALLNSGVLAWPLGARAQQSGKVWRIGFIAHRHERFYEPLFERLRELGYEEGRNLIVERRYAGGHAERFEEFAAEMVRLNVDLIIVITTPAVQVAKRATTTIPIVIRPLLIRWGLVLSPAWPDQAAMLQDLRFSMRNSARNVWRYSRR
jgi:putative ABC transport system substrate-binding protein